MADAPISKTYAVKEEVIDELKLILKKIEFPDVVYDANKKRMMENVIRMTRTEAKRALNLLEDY